MNEAKVRRDSPGEQERTMVSVTIISQRKKIRERGAVLLVMLFVLMVISTLGIVLSLRSVNEAALAQIQIYQTKAFWAAEAGVQRTFWEITTNNCAGMKNLQTDSACNSCASCGKGYLTVAGTLPGAEYEVLVNYEKSEAVASGYSPLKTSVKAKRNVYFNFGSNKLFGSAAFARSSMSFLNKAKVDSYNSNHGQYNVGGNTGSAGNIATNGTNGGAISLGDNVTIKGNIGTGSGGTVTKANGVTVTGTETHDVNVTLADVTVPTNLSEMPSGGVYNVSNDQSRTLVSGDYKYDYITMSNNSTLTISGAVQLYLTNATNALISANKVSIIVPTGSSLKIFTEGRFIVANNMSLNNQSQVPANFMIFSKYTGATGVAVSNNGDFYGAIYAPNTDVTISNNSGLYGSVVGKTLTLDKGQIHYDEALGTIGDPFSTSRVSKWLEI